MAIDDDLAGLFDGPSGGMDDLDTALFGKPLAQKKKTNTLSSILSNTEPTQRKSVVSFLEPSTSTPKPASKSSLDDLFGERSAPAPSSTPSRPSRLQSSAPAPIVTKPVNPPVETPTAKTTEVVNEYDQIRIQRLEAELARTNRELDDLKRKKRDDEEDIERLWKDRVAKLESENEAKLDQLKNEHSKHTEKIKNEFETEIDRMKTVYTRQMDDLTSSSGQSRDITKMADKMESLTDVIDKIATTFNVNNSNIVTEQELQIKLREEAVKNREERLRSDIERFEEEKTKVHELNLRLNEMCKQHEKDLNTEKYKIREQQRRLEAEKKLFKEDQAYIIDSIAKQKAEFDEKMNNFYSEQHDLLVRVNIERQTMENERSEFSTKRNLDIRRLRDEANKLDIKAQQVITAEKHIRDLQAVYESKIRQLSDLEASLMDECFEMERIREVRIVEKAHPQQSYRGDEDSRNNTVRAALRKHSELLDKYTGQKVATVAPQNL